MGTIAQKLEYLNTTKGLIKDSINLTGANITNDTFRSYAQKLKLGLINALNDNGETIFNNLEKVSGKGSNLSLTPTYEAPIELKGLYGKTEQNGTPTPSSPIPIESVTGEQDVVVCGKNLINGLLDNSTTGKKLERTINADENFYLYIKTNNTTSDRCYAFLDNTNVGTIWVSNNNGTLTFSGSRNFAFNRIRIQDNTTVSENMLTLGSTATTYEPYNGNTYEVNLGKNLLDASKGRLGTFSGLTISYSNGEILLNGTSNASVDFYVGTSTYNKEILDYMNSNVGSYTLSNNLDFENYFRIGSSYPQNTGTTTSTNKVDLIFVRIPVGTYNNKVLNIQLEKGSQATSYSPYFPPYELNTISTCEDIIKKSTGKNTLDYKYDNVKNVTRCTKSEEINGFKIISTGVSGFGYASLEIDNALLGKTITISMTSSGNKNPSGRLFNVNTSGNVTTAVSNFWTTNNSFTITLPSTLESGVKCIALCLYISQTNNSSGDYATFTNIQIEQNNQATTYEPYGKVWYVYKAIGKIVLDNTLNWQKSTTYSTDTYTMFFYNDEALFVQNYDGYCNRFEWGKTNDIRTGNKECVGNAGNSINIRILKSRLDTNDTNGLKTWLSNNDTIAYFILKKPTTTVITNTTLIEQLETLRKAKSKNGTTNIVITSQDLPMLMDVSVIKGDA